MDWWVRFLVCYAGYNLKFNRPRHTNVLLIPTLFMALQGWPGLPILTLLMQVVDANRLGSIS